MNLNHKGSVFCTTTVQDIADKAVLETAEDSKVAKLKVVDKYVVTRALTGEYN